MCSEKKRRHTISSDDLNSFIEVRWNNELEAQSLFWEDGSSFVEKLKRMAADYDDQLEKLGYPRWESQLLVENGKIVRKIMPGEHPGPNQSVMLGGLYIEQNAESLTDVWFLERLRRNLFFLLSQRDRNHIDTAIEYAFHLGRDFHALKTRPLLPKVTVGTKSLAGSERENLRRKRNSFKALHGTEAQSMAVRLHDEKPNRTFGKICEMIAKKFGCSSQTVRKSIKNPKNVR